MGASNITGIVSDSCECIIPVQFDCEESNAFWGDECIDDEGDEGQVDFNCECDTGFLNISVDLNNSANIQIGKTENSILNFHIIPLSEGFAVRVQPGSDIQILDSSTFGYPDALDIDSEISNINIWSTDSNFVLGTTVGHGGQFEGAGKKYLGFRLLDNNNTYYGWVSLENNNGSTLLLIDNYQIKFESDEPILAGQN